MSYERNTLYFIGDSKALLDLFAKQDKKPSIDGGWKIVCGSCQGDDVRLKLFSTDVDCVRNDVNRHEEMDQADVIFMVSSTSAQLKEMINLLAVGAPGRFAHKYFCFYGLKASEVDEDVLRDVQAVCGETGFKFIYRREELHREFDERKNMRRIIRQQSQETAQQRDMQRRLAEELKRPIVSFPSGPPQQLKRSGGCCNMYRIQFFASGASAVSGATLGGLAFAGVVSLTPVIVGLIALSATLALVFLLLGVLKRAEMRMQRASSSYVFDQVMR